MWAIHVSRIEGYSSEQINESLHNALEAEHSLKLIYWFDPTDGGRQNPWSMTFEKRELRFDPTHVVFALYRRSSFHSDERVYLIQAEPIEKGN